MLRAVSLISIGLALGACASASLRGGQIARQRAEPGGRVLREYVTEGCRDSRGQPAELQLRVRLLEGAPAQPLLVLRREGHDSMIVDNWSEQGTELVFQAVTTGGGGDPVLHDVRLPRRGAGPGRLAYARTFSERSSGERRFQAYFAVPALACRLAPLPLAAGNTAPIGPQ